MDVPETHVTLGTGHTRTTMYYITILTLSNYHVLITSICEMHIVCF